MTDDIAMFILPKYFNTVALVNSCMEKIGNELNSK